MKGSFLRIALPVFALNTLMVAAGASPMAAQDARVYLDAGLSHARPPSDVEVDPSTYAQLGGRLVVGPVFASVFGGLALSDSAADWIGGTLAASAAFTGFREPGFGITGLVSAFSVAEPSRYDAVTGRVIPEIYVPIGRLTAVLRGYGGVGRSEVQDRRTLPPTSVITDLWMFGGGGEIVGNLGGTRLWMGGEAYEAESGSYRAGYAGLSGALERILWSAALKVWDTPDDVEAELNLILSVPVGNAWSVQASGGRSGPDPLLDTPAAVDGSVSLSWDVFAPMEPPPPVFRIAEGQTPTVRFRVKREEASEVVLVGDFSNWEPVAMRRIGDFWVTEVQLKPGLYHFGFLVDGEWYVPEHAPGKVADEYGRTNASLVVPVGDAESP